MNLKDRVKGKTRFELCLMNLGDVRHTLDKIHAGKNTQVQYCLDIMHDELRYLRSLIPIVGDKGET